MRCKSIYSEIQQHYSAVQIDLNHIFCFSEYDSEMDDFIDDSDAKVDISAEIRNIFGYDRRKFRHEVIIISNCDRIKILTQIPVQSRHFPNLHTH